ncbi:hypothetical protein Tco_0491115 [Tanacetum coccineum]
MESYYTRFYNMMNEMIRNNLIVATMQVSVQFLQQLQLEWSRFVTIVKQQHKLDEVSYHKLFDILKHYQKEVNEIRTERIAKNANPLALVAAALPHQDPYYQAPKSYNSYAPTSKASLQTRSHATTRHKGKEIVKPITPPSESASEEDNADHVGCLDTRKSTSRGIQFLGDMLVSWMSKKQDCTAMSSTEAEYVALSASCAQVMWMRTTSRLWLQLQQNTVVLRLSVSHSNLIQPHAALPTEYQLADMFTKALPEERFQYLVRRIGMRCLTPAELEVLTNESA